MAQKSDRKGGGGGGRKRERGSGLFLFVLFLSQNGCMNLMKTHLSSPAYRSAVFHSSKSHHQ